MMFEIFSPKKLAKKIAFYVQNTAICFLNWHHKTLFLRKTPFFRQKWEKIAQKL
jgi:hypothetical protein